MPFAALTQGTEGRLETAVAAKATHLGVERWLRLNTGAVTILVVPYYTYSIVYRIPQSSVPIIQALMLGLKGLKLWA